MKIFKRILISVTLILFILPPCFAEELKGDFKAFSPKFLEWQEKKNLKRALPSDSESENYSGYIPFPVDLSHLSDNPPNENVEKLMKSDTIPTTYDLRSVNGKSYVTSVKSQSPYGTCWAFASIGAMESNMLKQGYSAMDLSEMHLAYYAFKNSDKSKAFYNISNFETFMMNGGNSFMPTALYARLSGPVNESEVPYGTTQPSASTPESYTRVLRLKEVYYISRQDDDFDINTNASNRNIIKRRIMENGSVVANYENVNSRYNKTDSNGTAYYSTESGEGHAIQIVGWDDNYSRSNFNKNPGIDGAWLIKNSWGNTWNYNSVGDDGYFWMSYKQDLTEGSSFIVEEADNGMNVYDYDPLGWCQSWGSSSASKIYFANVFKAERDENLTEIGFYTTNNNIKYEINIYKGMSSISVSSPINGSSVSSISGTIPYAGYHTVNLNKSVELSSGEYFSVVVNFTNYGWAPVEMKVNNFASNATIEEGSYFSLDGSSWSTGQAKNMNACVKAFTTSGITAPVITTEYPPDAYLNTAYSAKLTATGTKPITWTSSGNLPEGLTLDQNTGEISGTPTKLGNYTFSVTASNSIGSNTKSYTMNVKELPNISTTEFTGYVGYDFSGTLKINTYATWKTSDTLPKGLSLNATTGAITGKPKKAGTYQITFTAITLSGNFTTKVKITINAKPTAPKISTSSLTAGMIGEKYSASIKFSGTTPVTLSISGQPEGLTLNTNTGVLSGTPTQAGTFTMQVSISNIVTELTDASPVTKNVKLVIKAKAPVINAPSSIADGIVGEKYSDVQFTTSSGTEPITWTASGLPKGLSVNSSGLLSGTPTKAGNYNINLKASNSGGKTTARIPVKILQKPEIKTTKLSNATDGKKYTAKITASGTTPITWEISGLPEGFTKTANSTGTTLTITGTPNTSGTYAINVTANNSAGTTEKNLELNIKGVAPKLKASLASAKAGTNYTGSNISATGTLPITISYSINNSSINSIEDLGLTFTADPSTGTAEITGTPTVSIKSLPITFSATNIASTKPVTKKASFTINGEKAAFTSSGSTSITHEPGSSIELDFEVTGTRYITFSMNKVNGFTLTQTGDYTAHLSGTAPNKTGKTTINIYATNSAGKTTKKIVIQTKKVNATELQAQKISSITTFTPFESKSEIRLDAHNTKINLEDYEIIAKIPAISVDVGGMYDFHEIRISEDFEIGKKLIWLANPKEKEASEDDEIAEFYDIEGEEIETLPEDRIINVSAWLNPEGYYEPEIAIKRE